MDFSQRPAASPCKVLDSISKAPTDAIGLVVIVTNEYRQTHELPPLPGTRKDGQALSEALLELKFVVHWERNVSSGRLGQVVHEVSRLTHATVKNYRCIFFIFSGHGKEGDSLVMEDNEVVNLYEDVINPLLPRSANEIGGVQKIFLIDACRGSQVTDTVLVPRGQGGLLLDLQRIAADGGFLVAYSTLPLHMAYENPSKGGLWLSTIAELLKIKDKECLCSVETLLTEANRRLTERLQGQPYNFQQPDRQSRLNKVISLDPGM